MSATVDSASAQKLVQIPLFRALTVLVEGLESVLRVGISLLMVCPHNWLKVRDGYKLVVECKRSSLFRVTETSHAGYSRKARSGGGGAARKA
jgi:hypothetical protein